MSAAQDSSSAKPEHSADINLHAEVKLSAAMYKTPKMGGESDYGDESSTMSVRMTPGASVDRIRELIRREKEKLARIETESRVMTRKISRTPSVQQSPNTPASTIDQRERIFKLQRQLTSKHERNELLEKRTRGLDMYALIKDEENRLHDIEKEQARLSSLEETLHVEVERRRIALRAATVPRYDEMKAEEEAIRYEYHCTNRRVSEQRRRLREAEKMELHIMNSIEDFFIDFSTLIRRYFPEMKSSRYTMTSSQSSVSKYAPLAPDPMEIVTAENTDVNQELFQEAWNAYLRRMRALIGVYSEMLVSSKTHTDSFINNFQSFTAVYDLIERMNQYNERVRRGEITKDAEDEMIELRDMLHRQTDIAKDTIGEFAMGMEEMEMDIGQSQGGLGGNPLVMSAVGSKALEFEPGIEKTRQKNAMGKKSGSRKKRYKQQRVETETDHVDGDVSGERESESDEYNSSDREYSSSLSSDHSPSLMSSDDYSTDDDTQMANAHRTGAMRELLDSSSDDVAIQKVIKKIQKPQ